MTTKPTTVAVRLTDAHDLAAQETSGLHDHLGQLLAGASKETATWGRVGDLQRVRRLLAEAAAVLSGGEAEEYLEACRDNALGV